MKKRFRFACHCCGLLFLVMLMPGYSSSLQAQIITTFAGNGTSGATGDGGAATAAEFASPVGVVVDGSGNVYVADYDNCSVRKINAAGTITMIAGNGVFGFTGDGAAATAAQLDGPAGIAFDRSGNMYIADVDNNRIRKVTTSGIISTIAGSGLIGGFGGDGGPATAALLSLPSGVAVDSAGNVYIGDGGNCRIRKINTLGIISTYAGNGTPGYSGDGGPSTAAVVHTPAGMVVDKNGNLLFADDGNNCIRKINTVSGIITTFAGNDTMGYRGDGGQATAAEVNNPANIALDGGGSLYIADVGNNCIRRVNIYGIISTIAGNDTAGFRGDGGPAILAEFNTPVCVAFGGGNLYVADQNNYRVRKVTLPTLETNDIPGTLETLKVYPNPNSGSFAISLSSPANEDARIVITNMVGEKIKEAVMTTNKTLEVKIDAPPGIYFLTAITGAGKLSAKILVGSN